MADIQTIKLGGFLDEEVKKVNDNFDALNSAIPTVPTKVSDLTNDANYQTADEVASAVNAGLANVDVATKVSELENDEGYVKSSDPGYLNKVDAEDGKGLSTNDYTTADKKKVGNLGKIDFTASSFTAGADGYYTASIAAAGKYPVAIMRKNGSEYEAVLAHAKVNGDNIVIVSSEAFEGYVVTI